MDLPTKVTRTDRRTWTTTGLLPVTDTDLPTLIHTALLEEAVILMDLPTLTATVLLEEVATPTDHRTKVIHMVPLVETNSALLAEAVIRTAPLAEVVTPTALLVETVTRTARLTRTATDLAVTPTGRVTDVTTIISSIGSMTMT